MIIFSKLSFILCRYRVQVLFIKSRISSKNLTYRLVFYLKKKIANNIFSFFIRAYVLLFTPYMLLIVQYKAYTHHNNEKI